MPAREEKFTPAIINKILELVRAGSTLKTAAGVAQISQSTLTKWKAEGARQRDGHPKKTFFRDLRAAEKHAVSRNELLVNKAAQKDWRAAQWWLECRQPDEYGRKVKVEVERELDGMLDRLKRHLPPEAYDQVIQVLALDEKLPSNIGDYATGEGAALYALDSEHLDAE